MRVLVPALLMLTGCAQDTFEPPDLSALAPGVQQTLAGAEEVFEQSLATATTDVDRAAAWGRLCQHYHAHHLVTAAVDCYRQATSTAPTVFDWHYFLGHALRDTGDLSGAIAAFDRAAQLRPDNRAAVYHAAITRLDNGDIYQPGSLLRGIDPDGRDAAVQAAIGRTLLLQGDARTAVGYYERALSLQPGASRLRYPLAQAYRKLGRSRDAQHQLAQAGDVDPIFDDPLIAELASLSRSAQFLIDRGKAAYAAGDVTAAERDFRAAIAADPMDPSTHATLAILLNDLGQLQAAQAAIRRALELDGADPTLLFLDGRLAERLGDHEHSARRYAETLERDPRHFRAMFLLGNAAMRAARFDEALQWYEQATQLVPRDVNARYHAGLAALAAGDCETAVDWLTDAMSRQSNYAPVIIALVRARAVCPSLADLHEGNLDLARQLAEAVPGNETVAASLAMALAAVGQFDEALRVLPDGDRYDHNRSRYAAGLPADLPWRPDDPVFRPAPIQR
ncbi:MAG: tetratricopeptide repeat protein [Gammaproteobacteria bacterium]|nr:tetratricopeptide repeat protein [Gammaproteobacteria bacterium]